MKRRGKVVLAVAAGVAAVAAWMLRPGGATAGKVPLPADPKGSRAEFYRAFYLGAPTNPLAVGPLAASAAPAREKSFLETLAGKVDASDLEKYEGSYTLDDLRNPDGGASSFTLESSWLLWNTNLPRVGVKVWKNEKSGDYEPVGARVSLPGGKVGVSFEDDKETGESKTYLDVKRRF